ncbi:hypothetical protein JCM10213v2_008096 [Rhodosporidiobolus nylandii]
MPSQTTLDLHAARSTASFSSSALHSLLLRLSGSLTPSRRKELAALLEANPAFEKRTRPYVGRKERLEQGLRKTKRLLELKEEKGWTQDVYAAALGMVNEYMGLNLHEIAFAPVIEAQASDEQKREWMPKCREHEWVGCYMQTELGHGSNVQQLETTATYSPSTDSFVLHSPSVSSTKWWIGALGLLATHGVVQARLFIEGKDHGPHLFLVQLRDLDTHASLPGIEIGEIGPKVHGAMAALDNGYSDIHIPRGNMLARFARVKEGGKYVRVGHAKAAYGGMVFIRARMVGGAGWALAKGATITTRYLFQRRQFSSASSAHSPSGEQQVIRYPSVYMRLTLHGHLTAALSSSPTAPATSALLAETHALTAGLKVYCSTAAVEGLETLRRAMGGHGFLASAGVGRLYADELPGVTYEGDNYLLNLQVARAALKSYQAFSRSSSAPLTPFSAFLRSQSLATPLSLPSSPACWSSPALLLNLLDLRAALLTRRLALLLESGRAWEHLSWECVELSRAVSESWLARKMAEAVKEGGEFAKEIGASEREVLKKVVLFFLLNLALSAFPPVEALRSAVDATGRALLPELVGLTDAFAFSDWELDSVVGAYDGDVYERMLATAKEDEELNLGTEAERKRLISQYMLPMLRVGRKRTEKREVREAKL